MYPEELGYSKEHQWIKDEGNNRVRLGITHFAQDELGDVVFVELPQVGQEVEKDKPFSVVESVKAVSDIYTPVAGKVVEVNEELENQPELVNEDPYGTGWIAIIELSNPEHMDTLLSVSDYKSHIGED